MPRKKAGPTNAETHQELAKEIKNRTRVEEETKKNETGSNSMTKAMKEIDDYLLDET